MERMPSRHEERLVDQDQGVDLLPQNVALVEQPEARYRVIYEAHNFRPDHTAAELGDARAVSVEWSGPFNELAPRRALMSNFPRKSELVTRMAQRDIPLYFFDIEHGGDLDRFIWGVLPEIQKRGSDASLVAEFYVLAKLYAVGIKEEPIHRRDFLKMGAAMPFIVKAQLEDEQKRITQSTQSNRQYSPYEKNIVRARELLSPELTAVQFTLRDAVWAYKMKKGIVPETAHGDSPLPEVAAIVGAQHVGFEDALRRSPEELLRTISAVMEALKVVTKTVGQKKLDIDISMLVRYNFDHLVGDWVGEERKQDPELKRIQDTYDAD